MCSGRYAPGSSTRSSGNNGNSELKRLPARQRMDHAPSGFYMLDLAGLRSIKDCGAAVCGTTASRNEQCPEEAREPLAGRNMVTASKSLVVARWVARVWSILSVLFVLAFFMGEAGSGPGPTAREWVGLAFWPIGVCVGLVVAWCREVVGGILALGCLLAFCAWDVLRSEHLPGGPFFFLVAAPALLFLAVGLLSHHGPARRSIRL